MALTPATNRTTPLTTTGNTVTTARPEDVNAKEAHVDILGRTKPHRLSKKMKEQAALLEQNRNIDPQLLGADAPLEDPALSEANQTTWRERLKKLDHETRIMYWVTFRHDHATISKDSIVRKLLPGVSCAKEEYISLRLEVMTRARNIKQALLKDAKILAANIASDDARIKRMGDRDSVALTRAFKSTFNPRNFYKLFRFLNGYIDIEKSTKLGDHYAKEIYGNLLMRAKLHIDAKDCGVKHGRNSRQEILKMIDKMRLVKEFDSVARSDFVELNEQRIHTKLTETGPVQSLEDDDRWFVEPFDGEQPTSDHTTQPAVEV